MMTAITPLRAIPSLGAHGQPPIWVMTAYGPPPIPVIQTRGPHPAMAWIHPYPSVHHPSVHPYAMAVGSIGREGYGANGTRDGGPYTTMARTTTSTTTTYGGSYYCYTSPQLMAVSWPPAHCAYPSNTSTGISILPSAGLHAVHGHQQWLVLGQWLCSVCGIPLDGRTSTTWGAHPVRGRLPPHQLCTS